MPFYKLNNRYYILSSIQYYIIPDKYYTQIPKKLFWKSAFEYKLKQSPKILNKALKYKSKPSIRRDFEILSKYPIDIQIPN